MPRNRRNFLLNAVAGCLGVTQSRPNESDFSELEPLVFENIQALRGQRVFGRVSPQIARTLGCIEAGDGGGGLWRWDSANKQQDDLITILLPTGHAGAGRWARLIDGFLTPEMAGAMGDATWNGSDWVGTDDTVAFQAMEDAAAESGVYCQLRNKRYLIAGTIKKRPGVNWFSAGRSHYSSSANSALTTFPTLCPSRTLPSARDAATGRWLNPVISIDYDRSKTFFADCTIEVNIHGAPCNLIGIPVQCPRVAFGIQNQAEVHIVGTIYSMRSAIASCGLMDSTFVGSIFYCGHDDTVDPVYALDLRTDRRVVTGQPGFGVGQFEIRGTNANTFEGRVVNCPLWFIVDSFNGSGGIRFSAMKIEDNLAGFSTGLSRNNHPGVVTFRTGDVYFSNGTSFRTLTDNGNKFVLHIQNRRTAFVGVGFLGRGRWLYHTGNGLVMTGCVTQVNRCDVSQFSFNNNVVATNMVVEHNMTGTTQRNFAAIEGSGVVIRDLVLKEVGRAQGQVEGSLFIIDASSKNVEISYLVNDPDAVACHCTMVNGAGENAAGYLYAKVERHGVASHRLTDADWGNGGEANSGHGILIRQKRRCATHYMLNAGRAEPPMLQAIIQGHIGERIVLSMDPASMYPITVRHSANLMLTGAVNKTFGVNLTYLVLECVHGNVWVESGPC